MKDSTTVGKSNIHGMGLFATKEISRGQVIGWLKSKPCQRNGPYVLWLGDGECIEVCCDLKYIVTTHPL